MRVHKVKKEDFESWLEMGLLLWPKYTENELRKEFEKIVASKREEAFLCDDGNGATIGFINVSIRHEYVPGTTSSPVGYVEGIFVQEQYRKKRIAQTLFWYGEEWAKSKGCKEMASDTELRNEASQKFHERLGFREKSILVHFIKKI
ncbi:GNAT family N-acetyltransferase [Candidatus Woesearchaeota archaeon]|nr:GNAT family N-acetyltransferase [Candidatus Woesearchaeota archaeon]